MHLGVALRPAGDPPDHRVRVLLVEDHTSVREANARMSEQDAGLHVVGQAATLAQAREMLHDIESLTPREREVLQGLDSATIATRLHITVRTERNHVANILAKLGVHSQLQAVLFAARYDLVKLD